MPDKINLPAINYFSPGSVMRRMELILPSSSPHAYENLIELQRVSILES